MTVIKLKQKDIKPLRDEMLQDACPLCNRTYEGLTPCLDHCHISGLIREPLCRNCNAMLGKIENAAIRAVGKSNVLPFLTRVRDYVNHHQNNPSTYEHYTHGVKKKRKKAA
ncbi:TPA: endonuclease domain-containing protein [Vibrio parahaemolyticus]